MIKRPIYFLPYQIAWLRDESPLKLMEKSRQIGISFVDAYDSVRKAGCRGARLDVWISSRDAMQAQLYLEDCASWAKLLELGARRLGRTVLDANGHASAHVLEFDSGRCIYSLSSNPNALAGKRGHVKLDEFALHQDQQLLYRVAKPVTTWGGQLCIISTHRGAESVFNQFVRDVKERGNPMGWSLHTVPLQKAVAEGLVERISARTGVPTTQAAFLAEIRAECMDDEQWQQEYCCVPADEAAAFISYELINACTETDCLRDFDYLAHSGNPFYVGVDVARRKDLCVIDVGEKVGDVIWDRLRLELLNRPFAEIEAELHRLLTCKQVKRACLDSTGMGMQLAERAQERFGWKVEPVVFTAQAKEELACGLRMDLQNRHVRLANDPELVADLRGIRKEVTLSGNIRYAGDAAGSHCDRFWAKALRQHAARVNRGAAASVA